MWVTKVRATINGDRKRIKNRKAFGLLGSEWTKRIVRKAEKLGRNYTLLFMMQKSRMQSEQ